MRWITESVEPKYALLLLFEVTYWLQQSACGQTKDCNSIKRRVPRADASLRGQNGIVRNWRENLPQQPHFPVLRSRHSHMQCDDGIPQG